MPDITLDPYRQKPATFAFRAEDNRGGPGEFDYFRAENGLVFIDRAPANLADYYEAGFQPIPPDVDALAQAAMSEKYKIDELERYVDGGDYLEIGPWIGMAAYNALLAGFNVKTLEMNADCVSLMRRAGIDAVQTVDPRNELANDPANYDAIVLWHSIEHVPNPWDLLALCATRLKPGGVLLVAAPNPDSAQARLFGRTWFHLDAPRHLYLLPIDMVREIGRDAGLETVNVTTDDTLGQLLDRQGWEWPLWKHALPKKWKQRVLLIPSRLLRFAMARLFRRRENDGAAYTIVMRRPL